MNDYYTKKKVPRDNPLAETLARWSLIIGIISLPTAIIPTLGIIIAAAACTLAALSFYNGDGYRATKAKVGLILGFITLAVSFFLSYVLIYAIAHWSEYRQFLQSAQ